MLPVHLQLGHAAGSTLQAMRAMWYRNGASKIISGAVYPGISALQAIDSIQDEDWGAYQRTLHFSHSVNRPTHVAMGRSGCWAGRLWQAD